MAHAKNHDFHILPPSIWPLLSSVGAFAMLFGAAAFAVFVAWFFRLVKGRT